VQACHGLAQSTPNVSGGAVVVVPLGTPASGVWHSCNVPFGNEFISIKINILLIKGIFLYFVPCAVHGNVQECCSIPCRIVSSCNVDAEQTSFTVMNLFLLK